MYTAVTKCEGFSSYTQTNSSATPHMVRCYHKPERQICQQRHKQQCCSYVDTHLFARDVNLMTINPQLGHHHLVVPVLVDGRVLYLTSVQTVIHPTQGLQTTQHNQSAQLKQCQQFGRCFCASLLFFCDVKYCKINDLYIQPCIMYMYM